MKTLIGFVPKELKFTDAAINLFNPISNGGGWDLSGVENHIKTHKIWFTEGSKMHNTFNRLGVLDLWFNKVYKDEFKIGNWIITDDCEEPTTDLVVDINDEYYVTETARKLNSNTLGFNKNTKGLRLATKEEIDKVIFRIGNYPIKFRPNGIIVDDIYYDKSELKVLQTLLGRKLIKLCKVGNNGKFDMDLNFVNKILEKIEKL